MNAIFETDIQDLELIGRGKVRDNLRGRRRASAHRGHGPAVGVRRGAPRSHPRQGRGADGAVALLVRADRWGRAQPLLDGGARGLRGGRRGAGGDRRSGDGGAPSRAAAHRGHRARLPHRLGVEGLPAHRDGVRDPAAVGAEAGRPAAGGHLHPLDQGRGRRARREHRLRRGGGARRPGAGRAGVRDASIRVYREAAEFAAARGIIIIARQPSSSSRSTPTANWCSSTRC